MSDRLIVLAVLAFFSMVPLAAADEPFERESLLMRDRLTLKSGVVILGKVSGETKEENGRTYITFQSDDGLWLKLDKARSVSKLQQISTADIEYNEMVKEMEDNAEEHRRLYQWCKSQRSGTVRYRDQIRFHRERIMKLDPNDEQVKRELGYEFVEEQGRWVPRNVYWDLLGYEKRGASWRPKLMADINGALDYNREASGDYRKRFGIWRKKWDKRNANRAALLFEFSQLVNSESVLIMKDEAIKERDPALRLAFVEAFGKINTYQAMSTLGYFAVEEPVEKIRDRALTLLQQPNFYNKNQVAAKLSGYLRLPSKPPLASLQQRELLQRAAYALGELKSEVAIVPLIDALQSTHQIKKGDDPGRMQTQRSTNGLQSFSVGGSGPKNAVFNNPAVVQALVKITGAEMEENVQYSKEAWNVWYVENHTLYDINLRD